MFARAGGCPIGVIDRPEPVPTGAILLLVVVVVLTEAVGATVGIKLEVVLVGAWIGAGSCCDDAAAAAATVEGAATTVWLIVVADDDEDTVEDETEVVLVMLVSTLLLVLLLLADAADELPNGAGNPLAGDCRICTGGRMVAGALAADTDEEMLLGGALLAAGV